MLWSDIKHIYLMIVAMLVGVLLSGIQAEMHSNITINAVTKNLYFLHCQFEVCFQGQRVSTSVFMPAFKIHI